MNDPIPYTVPPALMKSAETIDQLTFEIIAAIEAGDRAAKAGVERYREAGLALLAIKEQVGHGRWENLFAELAEKSRKSQRQLRRYILLAKSDTASDLQQSWEILTERAENDPETHHDATTVPPPAPPPPDVRQVTPPLSLLCDRCTRLGPSKNCKACADLQARRDKASGRGTPPPDREPGDDTETIAEDQQQAKAARASNGRPVFEWRHDVEQPLGNLVRAVDEFGKSHRAKESVEAKALRSLLERFQNMFKAWRKRVEK